MPYVDRPPNEAVKDAVARGLVPRQFVEWYPSHRCRCGHVQAVHDHDKGECDAKKCPCVEFEQDPAYLLPPYKSKPLAEVGPVVPLKP